eukprot:tig00000492_g1512.t1
MATSAIKNVAMTGLKLGMAAGRMGAKLAGSRLSALAGKSLAVGTKGGTSLGAKLASKSKGFAKEVVQDVVVQAAMTGGLAAASGVFKSPELPDGKGGSQTEEELKLIAKEKEALAGDLLKAINEMEKAELQVRLAAVDRYEKEMRELRAGERKVREEMANLRRESVAAWAKEMTAQSAEDRLMALKKVEENLIPSGLYLFQPDGTEKEQYFFIPDALLSPGALGPEGLAILPNRVLQIDAKMTFRGFLDKYPGVAPWLTPGKVELDDLNKFLEELTAVAAENIESAEDFFKEIDEAFQLGWFKEEEVHDWHFWDEWTPAASYASFAALLDLQIGEEERAGKIQSSSRSPPSDQLDAPPGVVSLADVAGEIESRPLITAGRVTPSGAAGSRSSSSSNDALVWGAGGAVLLAAIAAVVIARRRR